MMGSSYALGNGYFIVLPRSPPCWPLGLTFCILDTEFTVQWTRNEAIIKPISWLGSLLPLRVLLLVGINPFINAAIAHSSSARLFPPTLFASCNQRS